MQGRILKNYGADQQRFQISELHFDNLPYSTNVFVLENKIQDWGMLLSKFLYGSDAMGQKSRGSLFSVWSKKFVFHSNIYSFLDFELLTQGLHRSWTKMSRIPTSRQRSVWMNKRLRKQTDSFAEERSLTWSTITSKSLTSMNPYSIIPICLRLFFGMTTFRNSIRDGMKIYCQWSKSVQIKNTRIWETQDRIRILQLRDSSEEDETWLPQIENDGKKELSNIWGHETARLEMRRLSQTSWSRIKGDNVVFTKDKENVDNGRSAGSVRKETKFSFRHDGDERAKPTPSSARPEPSTPQDVTKSSENHTSWRPKSIWEIFSSVVQASSQRYFPEDRNCEICKRTKITRAPCRRRNGEAVPCAEKFGDLITADRKVLSENCESRNNHRYAVVVQDLATQWTQAYPCKKQTSGNSKKLAKVLGARWEA